MTSSKRFQVTPGTVYIVGAGPGAPDLIAVRGRDIIEQADFILYADSLVELSVAELAKKESAEILPSSGLHLEEMVGKMVEAARAGKVVARVHSGDPALYGATHEQMALLEDAQVPYVIIPGITAAFAAAALLQAELTIPDVVQTIILTRTAGRTTMPSGEDLRTLAAPGASLAIYLSVARIKKVIEDLLASGGYTVNSPVAVLHKTTWPDESHVIGTLGDIAEKVRKAGYTKHALVLVSPALDPALKGEDRRTSSHLYDKSYTHRFRKAENFKRGKEAREAKGEVSGVVRGDKHLGSEIKREGTAVIAVTRNGSQLATTVAAKLGATLALPQKFATETATSFADSALNEVRRQWGANKAHLVLVMPAGVATRAIAPILQNKMADPAVVCLDEAGRFIIPLVGGHVAGANALAQEIAALTGGVAAVTTASDVQGKLALDLLGRDAGWQIDAASGLTQASASLVNDEPMGLFVAEGLEKGAAVQETVETLLSYGHISQVNNLDELDVDEYSAGIVISHRPLSDHHQHVLRKSVLYRPAVLVAGIGCKRDTPLAELQEALETTLAAADLSLGSVRAIATADLKADEAGLIALAQALGLPLEIVASETLAALAPADFSPSAAQEKFGIAGVAEPCAVVISGGELVVQKQSFAQCTVAVAQAQ